ncbi:MAG: hypothetical protein KatS3mg061_1192 [Dehalococcoidia bacterium]|nr:MAG: hypothetical protein KatS3mg061_1192 [Dehalococcoidia bacterium]
MIALFFTPVALLFGLVVAGQTRERGRAGMRVLAAFALGLAIAAAYWLPALVENAFVSTGNFNTARLPAGASSQRVR